MAGRFDLAGVGPGDPELMTIKTIRAIKACQVLVLPIGSPELKKPELEEGEEETFAKECLAYRIACEAEPETKKKLRLYLPMPMISGGDLFRDSVFLCCGSKAGDLACGEPARAACSSGVLWN